MSALVRKRTNYCNAAIVRYVPIATDAPQHDPHKQKDRQRQDRGRDASYLAPPAQNRTGPIRAYGFHLGYLTANRTFGQG